MLHLLPLRIMMENNCILCIQQHNYAQVCHFSDQFCYLIDAIKRWWNVITAEPCMQLNGAGTPPHSVTTVQTLVPYDVTVQDGAASICDILPSFLYSW